MNTPELENELMEAKVTRDVISDLWPLYKAGEASADTKRLVEAFLAQDGDFKTLLKESDAIHGPLGDVQLSPDAELRLIALARERTRTMARLVGAAIGAFVFVALTFIGAALYTAFHYNPQG